MFSSVCYKHNQAVLLPLSCTLLSKMKVSNSPFSTISWKCGSSSLNDSFCVKQKPAMYWLMVSCHWTVSEDLVHVVNVNFIWRSTVNLFENNLIVVLRIFLWKMNITFFKCSTGAGIGQLDQVSIRCYFLTNFLVNPMQWYGHHHSEICSKMDPGFPYLVQF